MNEVYEHTGGARIGRYNVTWPFAKLHVNKDSLTIKAGLLGDYNFAPEDLYSIEPYYSIPLMGDGIRINHKSKYSESKIIFWTLSDPIQTIIRIKQTGFTEKITVPNEKDIENIKKLRDSERYPIKTWFYILKIIFFIGGIMYDLNHNKLLYYGTYFSLYSISLLNISLLFPQLQFLFIRKNNSISKIIDRVLIGFIWPLIILGYLLYWRVY